MSPRKVGLSVNTAVANRSSDEGIFEDYSKEPCSGKSSKKAGKKLKAKKSQTSLKYFNDDDPEMKALDKSFLTALRPPPPTRQLTEPLLPSTNRALTQELPKRNLSVLSYDTDASHGSAMSNETVKPSFYQRDASGRTTGHLAKRNVKHARSHNVLCSHKDIGEPLFPGQEQYPNTLSTLYIDDDLHPPACGRIARKPLATAESDSPPLAAPASDADKSVTSGDPAVAKRHSDPCEPPQPSPTSAYSDGGMVIPRKPVPEPVASYPYFHTIVPNSRFDMAARKAKETKAKESFASTSTTDSMSPASFSSSTGNNHESFTSQSSVDSEEAERRAEERRQAALRQEIQQAYSAVKIHEIRMDTGTFKWYRKIDLRQAEPRYNHPNHHREWDSKNLWCMTACVGRCSICKTTPCCEYYRLMELLGLEARLSRVSLPEEKRRVPQEKRPGVKDVEKIEASRRLKKIQQYMSIGDDEPTFMQCDNCKSKNICPECCGRCASEICSSVVCKNCKPNPWTACPGPCLAYYELLMMGQNKL